MNAVKLDRRNELLPGDTIRETKQLIDSPEIASLASDIIRDEGIEIGPASIGFLLVYPHISKKKPAKVKKCSRELRHYSGHDYIIEISGEVWDMLDRKTRRMMLLHQLLHLNPTYKAKNSEWVMKLNKPDFADFYEINESHGNDWYKTVQSVTGSLYDLAPKDEKQVSLF